MGELGMMDGKAEMVTGRGEVDKWEMAERLKRRTSVIVHGVEESEAKDAAERRESDRERVEDMFGSLDART